MTLLVLEMCDPLDMGGNLPVFPGGVVVVGVVGVVGVVAVPLPPTIVSINITALSTFSAHMHI